MENIFRDKSITLHLSYCFNLILLDLTVTARSGAGPGDAQLAES